MKQKNAFITGIAGFAGQYLAQELLASGYKVSGTTFKGDPKDTIASLKKDVTLYPLDICNSAKTKNLIQTIDPEYLFHLAGFSSVGRSFTNERLTYSINFEGTLNVLEAAVDLKNLKKLVFISSSEVYGKFTPNNKTLKEDNPFNPVSPYSISKVAAEHLCRHYYSSFSLPVVIARAFNHSGPGQNENFVIPSFCRQIARIENGKQKPVMNVGDLSVKRDISDVRDITYGYRLLAEKGKDNRAYQLCSGKSISIKSLLDKLIKLSKSKISVEIDKKIFRKNDIPIIRGDYSRAKKELGFSPNYTIDKTLLDSLEYWRKRL